MVFSSTVFLFLFLPVVYLVNLLVRGRARNWWLLSASLFFYAWGEPVYVLVMLGSIVFNYFMALKIDACLENPARKAWLTVAVVGNLAALVFFKYANFLVDNLNAATGIHIPLGKVMLPVGISFFTFHAISYVVDVYRRTCRAQTRLSDMALYIAFFPQLIAGPIIKYHDIDFQIESRKMTAEKTLKGIQRFVIGLSKKLLLANALGKIADAVFALSPAEANMPVAWLGAITYTLQIYLDFSGYSDMAIGLGRMFGFEIPENFNYPFVARSVREFWRRWHISLTTWFREYVYIPLGGNRMGLARTCLNMTVVFFCTGFWHGAEWTFVVWGMFHGFFMILETLGVIRAKDWKMKMLAHLYSLGVVVVAFVLFRATSFSQGFGLIANLFMGFRFDAAHMLTLTSLLSPTALLTLAVSVLVSLPILPGLAKAFMEKKPGRMRALAVAGAVCTAALFLLCLMSLASSTYNPFIYYRF